MELAPRKRRGEKDEQLCGPLPRNYACSHLQFLGMGTMATPKVPFPLNANTLQGKFPQAGNGLVKMKKQKREGPIMCLCCSKNCLSQMNYVIATLPALGQNIQPKHLHWSSCPGGARIPQTSAAAVNTSGETEGFCKVVWVQLLMLGLLPDWTIVLHTTWDFPWGWLGSFIWYKIQSSSFLPLRPPMSWNWAV